MASSVFIWPGMFAVSAGVVTWDSSITALLLPASDYINWGTVSGTSGYGIRDNGGVIEFKDSGGSWAAVGGGSGTVTSVAQTVPGGFSISGSPITTTGTLAIAANGTSGGILGYTGTTTMASSAALAAGFTVIGGGAGATPTAVATGAPVVSVLTDGATPALDASLGTVFTLIAAGDRTIAVPTNATSGQKIIIRVLASGGARTLALNTGAGGFRYGSDITGLTITASGKYDYIGCCYNAAASFWDVIAYTKGF